MKITAHKSSIAMYAVCITFLIGGVMVKPPSDQDIWNSLMDDPRTMTWEEQEMAKRIGVIETLAVLEELNGLYED